jgi:hypothetical protein
MSMILVEFIRFVRSNCIADARADLQVTQVYVYDCNQRTRKESEVNDR